jgi:Family of unknown function (DUF5675)
VSSVAIPILKLNRTSTGDQGTFGMITNTANGGTYVTGELPWRGNQPNISCIPEGTYTCKWLWSPSHARNLYHVMDVPDRDAIEIHSGNYCGDEALGWRSDLLGCCLIANGIGSEELEGGQVQKIVTDSMAALAKFESELNGVDFTLVIKSAFVA